MTDARLIVDLGLSTRAQNVLRAALDYGVPFDELTVDGLVRAWQLSGKRLIKEPSCGKHTLAEIAGAIPEMAAARQYNAGIEFACGFLQLPPGDADRLRAAARRAGLYVDSAGSMQAPRTAAD